MPVNIDELLKQDEARLREKKKRLKAFTSALEDTRAATQRASQAAQELINSGDLSRSDIVKVFGLTKGEKSDLLPASNRRASSTTKDPAEQRPHASDSQPDEGTQYPANPPAQQINHSKHNI